MTEKILQHKHCSICGKAVPVEETFCSDECKEKWDAMVKKRKMMMYIMYGMIVVFIVLILYAQRYAQR